MVQKRDMCPCCGSSESQLLFQLSGRKEVRSSWGVASGKRVIYRCCRCDLQFAEDIWADIPEDLLYTNEYHDSMAGDRENLQASGALEQAEDRCRLVSQFLPSGTLLDVGCSTGLFIKAGHGHGFQCFGLDPSQYACEQAMELNNVQSDRVERATIAESQLLTTQQFDAITMWDVIEHCTHIKSDMRKIVAGLKPGGLLFLRTPDSSSLFFGLARLLHGLSLGRIEYPRAALYHFDHFLFFNRKSIRYFLEQLGLRVQLEQSDPLLWKRFKYSECRRGAGLNTVLGGLYWLGRVLGKGHGIITVAQKE